MTKSLQSINYSRALIEEEVAGTSVQTEDGNCRSFYDESAFKAACKKFPIADEQPPANLFPGELVSLHKQAMKPLPENVSMLTLQFGYPVTWDKVLKFLRLA